MSDTTLRMKDRLEVPNGGWKFFQAATQWTAPFTIHDSFDAAVRKIIAHRQGNSRFNLPTEYEAVALELEDFTARSLTNRGLAKQYVQGAEKKTMNPEGSITQRALGAVAALVAEVKKDANGARSLAEWIGEGAHPVEKEQAESRASTCRKCPMNRGRTGRIKEAVAAAIAEYSKVKMTIGLHVRDEGSIKTCAACDCPLKLKVWVPLKHILSHTNANIFPDNCWVVKENKLPQTPEKPFPPDPVKPTITIGRWGAFGDVITATALASRLHSTGHRVRFATGKAIMPMLVGHPDIAEVVEHGTVNTDINLDGAYEQHTERNQRTILSIFEEVARKQIKNPDQTLGTNGHYRPRLIVTEEEKEPFAKLFAKFKKPWVVIVPKSGKWKNRSVPDETWLAVAARVNGTCFWTGYERIGAPIVDLGTRDFRKVMAAISCANLVVTVDTGPMHAAAALDKPILAIQQAFDLTLRLDKEADWESFSPDLDCLKCGEFECPINKADPPCTHVDPVKLADAINARTSEPQSRIGPDAPVSIRKRGTTAYVSLGAFGDIAAVIPAFWKISQNTGQPVDVIVSRKYSSIFHGISYVTPHVIDCACNDVGKASALASQLGFAPRMAQMYGTGLSHAENSFIQDSWRHLGMPGQWDMFPLIFDRRDGNRELALCKQVNPDGKRMVLVGTSGKSSPFKHSRKLFRILSEAMPEIRFVDLDSVHAELIYDLVGLYDSADALVSIDTSHLHLSRASKVPVVALITTDPVPWHGSPPYRNQQGRFLYRDFDRVSDEIVSRVKAILAPATRLGRRIIHVYSDFPRSGGSLKRHTIASQTWQDEYARGSWTQVSIPDNSLPRNSKTACGDSRALPFLKDLIDIGASKATSDSDLIVFTNDDTCMVAGLTGKIIHGARFDAPLYAHRWDFDSLNGPVQTLHGSKWYPGSDLFVFTAGWWKRRRVEFPDLLVACEFWDCVLRQMMKRDGGFELHDSIYHEFHDSLWQKPGFRENNAGQQFNRGKTMQWFSENKSDDKDPWRSTWNLP